MNEALRLTRPRGAALLATWSAVLTSILTVADESRATLLDPLSAEQAALLLLYLATSLWWFQPLRIAPLAYSHLFVTGVFLALHPLTDAWGRDGTFVVTALHLALALLLLTPARVETQMLAGALLLGLAASETVLSMVDRPGPREAGLRDYGDLMGPYGEGGFLIPNLNARVVGPEGPVEFVTESHGFRNRQEIPREKPAGRRRVLILGDSFVAGYRTDQERTVGRVLERALRDLPGGATVDVVVAGVGHPGAALDWLRRHGWGFQPDLVLLGVTLGNDVSQSWLARHRLPSDALAGLFLPSDAYRSGFPGLFPVKLDRTLSRWRVYRRGRGLVATDVIRSWYRDVPAAVHQMDPGHSLGHFYAGSPQAAVEISFRDLLADLAEIEAASAARGIPMLAVLIPQRFQTSPSEWSATGFAYGLDPRAFERERPNRVILQGCATRKVECFDLLPGFVGEAPRGLYQPRGDMHWSEAGHERAGRLLAVEIARRYPALIRPSPG